MKMSVGLSLFLLAAGCSSGASKSSPDIASQKLPGPYVAAIATIRGHGLPSVKGLKFAHVKPVPLGENIYRLPADALGWVTADNEHAILTDGVEYPISAVVDEQPLDAVLNPPFNAQDREPVMGPIGLATPALMLDAGRGDIADKLVTPLFLDQRDSQLLLFDHFLKTYNALAGQDLVAKRDSSGLHWAQLMLEVAKVDPRRPNGNVPDVVTSFFFTMTTREYAEKLVADFQRRTASGAGAAADAGVPNQLGPANDTQRLIFGLSEVTDSTMGAVQTPEFRSLMQLGTKAIPDLIEMLDHNEQFTRCAHPQNVYRMSEMGPHEPTCHIDTVRDVCWMLITSSWHAAGQMQRKNPHETAEALRRAWKQTGDASPISQWIAVLRDNTATPHQWGEAAIAITAPAQPFKKVETLTVSPQNVDETTGLFIKRATQIGSKAPMDEQVDALQIGICLARWNPGASKAALAAVCHSALEFAADPHQNAQALAEGFGRYFASVISHRLVMGDSAALADYATFAHRIEGCQEIQPSVFRPIWENPNNSALDKIATRLLAPQREGFLSSKSDPFTRALATLQNHSSASPLFLVPAYRRIMVSGIGNQTPYGEAWADGDKIRYQGIRAGTVTPRGGLFPGRVKITYGDMVAQWLEKLRAAPDYSMLMPSKEREAAKAKMRRWLNGPGDWRKMLSQNAYFNVPDDF